MNPRGRAHNIPPCVCEPRQDSIGPYARRPILPPPLRNAPRTGSRRPAPGTHQFRRPPAAPSPGFQAETLTPAVRDASRLGRDRSINRGRAE